MRSENEIVSNWSGDINKPLVSVCCIAFNHEHYIEDALRSFLMQKTDFSFEIIIHDDASTDNTTRIIRKYAKKYPFIIKPIIQNANQFSQGKKIIPILASKAIGEYIAICEGDDYWLNKNKLAMQVNLMWENPEYRLCCHPALVHITSFGLTKNITGFHGKNNKIINLKTMIEGGGGVCPTASIMMKRSVFLEMPPWFHRVPISDYYFQVISSTPHGALYLPDAMSAYRTGNPHSFTQQDLKKNEDEIVLRIERDHIALANLLNYTGSKYIDSIRKIESIWLKEHAMLSLRNGYKKTFERLITDCWKTYPNSSTTQRVAYYFRNFPFILIVAIRIKSVINKYVL